MHFQPFLLCFFPILIFSKPRFSSTGIFPIDVGYNGASPLAFADFDSDSFTDIISYQSPNIVISRWNNHNFAFENYLEFFSPEKPKNVFVGDFNYDGAVDIIVVGNSNSYMFHGYLNNVSSPLIIMSSTDFGSPQPTLFDYDGNLLPDFIGVNDGRVAIWKNNGTAFLVENNIDSFCVPKDPHSNAFVDINGDCIPDLVLFCGNEIQIWINKKNGFVLGYKNTMPEYSGQVTFVDIDRDGAVDMLFPSLDNNNEYFINVAYNEQRPMCGISSNSSHCRSSENLCFADDDFSFSFDRNNATQL